MIEQRPGVPPHDVLPRVTAGNPMETELTGEKFEAAATEIIENAGGIVLMPVLPECPRRQASIIPSLDEPEPTLVCKIRRLLERTA